jgi:ABC-type glutathione transport system ATPase component
MKITTTVYCIFIFMMLLSAQSCYQYQTFSVLQTGEIIRLRNAETVYQKRTKGYETKLKEYHLQFSNDSIAADTNALKSYAQWIINKAEGDRAQHFLKTCNVVMETDSAGYFQLNRRGLRDYQISCTFNLKSGSIIYRGAAGKF